MNNNSLFDRISRRLQQFLHVYEIRVMIGFLRYYIYRYILRNLKSYSGEQGHIGKDTLAYNFRHIARSLKMHSRVYHMLRPVLAIEDVAKRIPDIRTLSIGPRSEGELLLIAAHGFTWRNIKGIDLFSYSPKIDVGDMHHMPYPDNSFDIIFSGWVLGYSDDQEQALKEMVRVLKPGGYVAFGQGYFAFTAEEYLEEHGELPLGTKYIINEIDNIFAPIRNNIETVYFRHEVSEEMYKDDHHAILTVFSIKKEN